jgi:ubiquinone/menaquinone biosynthesis C-methylase UbiE
MPYNNFLMKSYPKISRNLDERKNNINNEIRNIARKFEKDFFDGERIYGYGGYKYDGRWKPVVKDFIEYYNLTSNSSILDIGAGKGFMMKDFMDALPGANIQGIDISNYAVTNCMKEVKNNLFVGNALELFFEKKSFDLVISINTLHNLDLKDFKKSIEEIKRVSRKHCFIVLDAWNNEIEKQRIMDWNLTAKTILSVNDWELLFNELSFTGDYDWFIP